MAELFPIPEPDSIVNLLQLVNEYVPQAWNVMAFVIWMVIFFSSASPSLPQKLAMSFFITSILSLLMFVLGLVNEMVVIAMVIGTALSVLWLYLRGG